MESPRTSNVTGLAKVAALFVVRHASFNLTICAIGCAVWTIAYVILLIVAVVSGESVGSPVVWPIGILVVLVCCLVIGGGLFAPACAVGLLTVRRLHWSKLSALPIAFASMVFMVLLLAFLFNGMRAGFPLEEAAMVVGLLVVPFGLYWVLTEGPWIVTSFIGRVWRGRR